jgi:hypothetical protein
MALEDGKYGDEASENEGVKTKTCWCNNIHFSAKVKIDDKGKIEFVEDIYEEPATMVEPHNIEALINSGLVQHAAIQQGKLNIQLDEDGNLEIN